MGKRTNGNGFIGILLLLFFMVGIPSFLIKEVTKTESKSAIIKQTNDSVSIENISGPIIDKVGNIFTKRGFQELSSFIIDLNNTKGIQIAVLVVPEMNGEDIESFSMRHAEKWAIGQKGVDNGALLVVSMKEHAVRIETGYGTESVLTDAKCARILRNIIIPFFKSGDYESGIIKGVQCMAAIIAEDESMITSDSVKIESSKTARMPSSLIFSFFIIFIFVFLFTIVSTDKRHKNGFFFFPFFLGGFDSHHDDWGSGDFGSGFSGGGGSFGGGGASSNW